MKPRAGLLTEEVYSPRRTTDPAELGDTNGTHCSCEIERGAKCPEQMPEFLATSTVDFPQKVGEGTEEKLKGFPGSLTGIKNNIPP